LCGGNYEVCKGSKAEDMQNRHINRQPEVIGVKSTRPEPPESDTKQDNNTEGKEDILHPGNYTSNVRIFSLLPCWPENAFQTDTLIRRKQ